MTVAASAQILTFPGRRPGGRSDAWAGGRAALLHTFAEGRHDQESVFWLKENAELLNILECTGSPVPADGATVFAEFYETIERRMGFFRPYYRFILSICLDLEDLGLFTSNKAEALARWVRAQDLAGAELSDLQRAEACRLLARRGIPLELPGLDQRLRDFTERSALFALPNKKIGYELTHIVFYLSEYGRRDPGLSDAALRSLDYLGLVSFLDQDADLLAEVAIALSYAGAEVPSIWQDWLAAQLAGFDIIEDGFDGQPDDYHTYFVGNWWQAVAGGQVFRRNLPSGATGLRRPGGAGALRSLSRALYAAEPCRFANWDVAQRDLSSCIDHQDLKLLDLAAQSSSRFDTFYALFARSSGTGPAQAAGL